MRSASSLMTRERLLPLGILTLALAVRLWDIRARALWFDEAGEYWIATAPFSRLIESARTGTGDPPLYTFLLHVWMQLGTSEIWLRLFSTLVSVSGVAGVMVLARRVSGPTTALLAGFLLAVLPADVRYAQEVGQYGLVPAVVAWNLVFLIGMTRERTWRSVLGWALTALAGSYLYYATVFPIAACFLCVALESIGRRDMRTRRTTGTALVVYVLGVLPLLLSYLPTQLSRVIESGGVRTVPVETAGGLLGSLQSLWTHVRAVLAFQFTGWPHTGIPPALAVVPVVALIIWSARRGSRIVVWLLASLTAYGIAYKFGLFPMGFRWGMILVPLIICAIATGVTAGLATRARWAMVAAFILLAGVCVISLPNRTLYDRMHPENTGAWPETEDMRVVAEYWMQNRAPGQTTYVYYGAAPAFAYYTRELASRAGQPSTWYFACWHNENPPSYCQQDNIYYGRWIRSRGDREKLESAMTTLGSPPQSLWLVFSHMVPSDDHKMIAGFIRQGYRLEAAAQGVNASACLLIRNQ